MVSARVPVRRAVAVTGVVQGVGFRPFVHALASRHALAGLVRNRGGGVWIEVEGDAAAIDAFLRDLGERPPPLARIDRVRCEPQPARGDRVFRIDASEAAEDDRIAVAADAATCDACLAELRDPACRRYRYPFVNCAHCGPRLTIVAGAPYDRQRTTMAGFTMCSACRREYDDPSDRRFHAQPIACPACGPRLRAVDPSGAPLEGDPLAVAGRALRAGRIVAIKGLGGYHLACAAADDAAVRELRRRKKRDDKPFAVLVADAAAAALIAEVSAEERALLISPARPIVLSRRRASSPDAAVADAVAPGCADLGVMLPYTPLHHLLVQDLGGDPIVLTSGNLSDEPIAYDDAEAIARLGPIADVLLVHDRSIQTRCDDSVARVLRTPGPTPTPVRRSRGFAPAAIPLPVEVVQPTLAMGGQLKATFALAAGRSAIVSHHLGDLDHWEALRAYREALVAYERLFRVAPVRVVHDMHPDYASTREAIARAAGGPSIVAVQHHHAHMASCMADAGLPGPAIGVVFDGAGFGDDGAVWGGEILVGGYAGVRRAAHLAYVPMPGGARAMREPWRMAVAHLGAAGVTAAHTPLGSRIEARALADVTQLAAQGAGVPTSSVGRLFDAVASLAGVCDRASFEGQAPMALEALAGRGPAEDGYGFGCVEGDPLVLDPAPVLREVVADLRRGAGADRIARRFHDGLAAATADACARVAAREGIEDVVLSGGVFVNARLTEHLTRRLRRAGLRPHTHRVVPPNDGGLCLGQVAVAAARDAFGPRA